MYSHTLTYSNTFQNNAKMMNLTLDQCTADILGYFTKQNKKNPKQQKPLLESSKVFSVLQSFPIVPGHKPKIICLHVFTGAIMPIKLQYVELNKWKSSSSCPSHLHFSSMLYENWQSCFSCACSIVASVGTFCKTMCSTCQSSFFRMGKKNNFSDF